MSVKRCSEIKPLLLPYLHGEVARSERALVHAHLSACADCQRELAAWRNTEQALQRGLTERAAAKAPALAWVRLQSALQAEAQPQPQPHVGVWTHVGALLRRAAPVVTAMSVLALGLQAFIHAPRSIGVPESTPAMSQPFLPKLVATRPADAVLAPAATAPALNAGPLTGAETVAPNGDAGAGPAEALETESRGRFAQRAPVISAATVRQITRRSYLLPPVSGELVEDGVPVRPCGACANNEPDAQPSAFAALALAPEPLTAKPGAICLTCAILR